MLHFLANIRRCWLLPATLLLAANAAADGEQHIAEIGSCPLISGATIADCKIGYRTFGRMNDERSNVVLFPSWFAGTAADYADFGYVGPGRTADSSKYFVIAVDALGDGVSSSPSNQDPFPAITVVDMVESQHLLLTQALGISRVHAVVGISMGGMQALEWAVRYPDFMQKTVAINATPKQTAYDLLLWKTHLLVLQGFPAVDREDRVRLIAGIAALMLTTPEHVAATTAAADHGKLLARSIDFVNRFDLADRESQLEAMIQHDISARFGGSLQAAAAKLQSELLLVVSATDHMVNPAPAAEFALLSGAQLVELDGRCGHIAASCDQERLQSVVQDFLDR